MKKSHVTRRDFNKLTMAAFGGLVTGTVAGCGGPAAEQGQQAEQGGAPPAEGQASAESGAGEGSGEHEHQHEDETAMADSNLLLEEPHVCRGLNTCKGKGASGDNECAGQGTCATAEHHGCQGQNACKGQGGCGEAPGQNACKGQGNCAVPLMEDAWTKARAQLEKAMAAQNKQLGPAPPKS